MFKFLVTYRTLPYLAPEDGSGGGASGAATTAAAATGTAAASGSAATGTAAATGAATPGAAATGTAAAGAAAATPPVFADTLPEDIRGDAAFKDIKDLPALAKSYLNAHKMVGLDKATLVALPPATADAATMDAFYTKLGRPEAADKYTVPKPAEGKTYSDADVAFQKTILPVLHKAGLTQRQLDIIAPEWNAMAAQGAQQVEAQTAAARTAGEATLRTDWGTAFEQNIGFAGQAISHYAGELKLGDGIVKDLDASGMGNNPNLAKLLAHLGKQLQEDGKLEGRATGSSPLNSPTEAKQQIAAKQNDKAFMNVYHDKRAPGHAEAVAEMARLYQQAHPEPAKAG